MAKWYNSDTEPPKEEGRYLCIVKGIGGYYHEVVTYTKNLESVDKYDFQGDERPGWYDYDSEWGYYENTGVLYWMPLPELPDESKD